MRAVCLDGFSAAPLVWLDIVKNEILQESQKTNSARYGPILPCFSPVSHSFMLNGPNSNFKFMTGQPNSLQSLKKGQKLTEYNPFMDRRMHTQFVCVYGDNLHIITIQKEENLLSHKKIHSLFSGSAYHNPQILI